MHQESSKVISLSPRTLCFLSIALFACFLLLPSCASSPAVNYKENPDQMHLAGHARGAKLFRKKCQECHGLHAPSRRSDAQWARIMHEMAWEADLNEEQENLILAYLQGAN